MGLGMKKRVGGVWGIVQIVVLRTPPYSLQRALSFRIEAAAVQTLMYFDEPLLITRH